MLWRAIESVLAQDVDVEPIVVANGSQHDPALLAEIRGDSRLRVEFLEEGNLAAAQHYGRSLVSRPYFSFLDDDDEYLPGALRTRAEPLLTDPDIDVVATNGVWSGSDEPHIRETHGIDEDPMGTLLRSNWLASCGGLFRTATVSESIFGDDVQYFEWTMVGFRIAAAGLRVRFLDVSTYRLNETEHSLSRSDAYFEAEPGFLEDLLKYPLEPRYIDQIRRKRVSSLHTLAERSVRRGEMGRAWSYHLRSLRGRHGIRHVLYSRRLVLCTLGAWLRGQSD
jgi:glycosyltransferase involved in cell wall biosynthesis